MTREWCNNITLAVVSSLIGLFLLAGGYEVYENIKYNAWKARYDDRQLFGRLTVASPNKKLMWEYRPNGSYPRLLMRTNRYGFRERDLTTPDKPHGVYRIAFVGDSVTLGQGVAEEDTFTRKLEIFANGLKPINKIQTLNFGVDGYNTIQIHELVQTKVLEFSPDKLIYMLHLNDFDFEDASGEKIKFFRPPTLFLPGAIRTTYRKFLYPDLPNNTPLYHRYHFENRREIVLEHIKRMHALVTRRGIEFQVGILPVFHHDMVNYPYANINREILERLKANGIKAFDLADAFTGPGHHAAPFAIDLWHPNRAGHRKMAINLLAPVVPNTLYGGASGPGVWRTIAAERLRLDLAPLQVVGVNNVAMRFDSRGSFQERAIFGQSEGSLFLEYFLDRPFPSKLVQQLKSSSVLVAKMRMDLRKDQLSPDSIKISSLNEGTNIGNYATYVLPGNGFRCIYGVAAAELKIGFEFKTGTPDTYVVINYCASVLSESRFARFLSTLRLAP